MGFVGVFGEPGGALLSRALRRSTIGAEGFHGRVRDGIGWGPFAMATGLSEDRQIQGCCRKTVSDGGFDEVLHWAFRARATGSGRGVRSLVGGAPAGPVPGLGSVHGWLVSKAEASDRGHFCPLSSVLCLLHGKPVERLVKLSFTRYRASTCFLSTWWSSTALKRDLVSRGVSRLDAFSGYPVRT